MHVHIYFSSQSKLSTYLFSDLSSLCCFFGCRILHRPFSGSCLCNIKDIVLQQPVTGEHATELQVLPQKKKQAFAFSKQWIQILKFQCCLLVLRIYELLVADVINFQEMCPMNVFDIEDLAGGVRAAKVFADVFDMEWWNYSFFRAHRNRNIAMRLSLFHICVYSCSPAASHY